jgi:hypothetical protein
LRYVVVDGSGVDLSEAINKLLKKLPLKIDIEILHFKNNCAKVRMLGKGYGEGEIIEFALKNSQLLANSNHFMKCTGKLWIKNLTAIINRYQGQMAFDYRGRMRPTLVDTRFYICKTSEYKKYLAHAHHSVDESNGRNLEHCIADSLSAVPIHQWAMLPPAVVNGMSGSMGIEYREIAWRYIIRYTRALLIRAFKIK